MGTTRQGILWAPAYAHGHKLIKEAPKCTYLAKTHLQSYTRHHEANTQGTLSYPLSLSLQLPQEQVPVTVHTTPDTLPAVSCLLLNAPMAGPWFKLYCLFPSPTRQ